MRQNNQPRTINNSNFALAKHTPPSEAKPMWSGITQAGNFSY
jgi:hypothetical protein